MNLFFCPSSTPFPGSTIWQLCFRLTTSLLLRLRIFLFLRFFFDRPLLQFFLDRPLVRVSLFLPPQQAFLLFFFFIFFFLFAFTSIYFFLLFFALCPLFYLFFNFFFDELLTANTFILFLSCLLFEGLSIFSILFKFIFEFNSFLNFDVEFIENRIGTHSYSVSFNGCLLVCFLNWQSYFFGLYLHLQLIVSCVENQNFSFLVDLHTSVCCGLCHLVFELDFV